MPLLSVLVVTCEVISVLCSVTRITGIRHVEQWNRTGSITDAIPVTVLTICPGIHKIKSTNILWYETVCCTTRMCFIGFNVVCPNTCCVGGKVAAGSRAQSEEPPSLHHHVMSGTSCQDRHSPEAQAKVKIKSLVESAARWPHPTGQAVGYEGLWALYATPLGVPECSTAEVSSWDHRLLTCPGRAFLSSLISTMAHLPR